MSAIATAWAWSQIRRGRVANVAARIVLLKLADRADDQGICWPGHEKTAGDCDLSEKGARKALLELEDALLVEVERRRDRAGRDLSNRYCLPVLGEGERSTPREEPSTPREEPSTPESNTNTRSSSLLKELPTTTTAPEAHLDDLVIELVLTKFKSQLIKALQLAGVTDQLLAQDLVDELANAVELGQRGERSKVGSPIAWLRTLIQRHAKGKFDRVGCLVIQARRLSAKDKKSGQQIVSVPDLVTDPLAMAKGEAFMAGVRRNIQSKSTQQEIANDRH